MASDALMLYALSKELNKTLKGGRIVKVNQPEKDELSLVIYNNNQNYRLTISISGTFSRINISNHNKENPLNAPSFCMHLRKELEKGVINYIEVRDFERILTINISAFSELYDIEEKELQVELMGKYNNIVLVKKGGIVDCMKRIPIDISVDRSILPGANYTLPSKQNKVSFSDTKEIASLLSKFNEGSLCSYLANNVLGISYNTAREIVYRSINVMDKDSALNDDEKTRIIHSIEELINKIEKCEFTPCVLCDDKKEPIEALFIPYHSLSFNYKYFDTISEALEYCFFNKSNHASFAQRGKSTLNVIKNNIAKNEKKLGLQLNKQLEYANYWKNKEYGDLILSNLYKINKGDSAIKCTNFDNNEEITIPLDNKLTPQQNAQSYYKRYNKQKRSIEMIDDQIKKTKENLDFLYSIKESFRKCTKENELLEIEEELTNAGYIKQSSKKKVRFEGSKPNKYEWNDCSIYVGKNSVQNEHVTFTTGSEKDLWFHVKGNHGSHVILKGEHSDENIRKAAEIAAFYSGSHTSNKVEVDYTLRINVKKIKDKRIGHVTYTNQTSIMVSPKDYIENLVTKS